MVNKKGSALGIRTIVIVVIVLVVVVAVGMWAGPAVNKGITNLNNGMDNNLRDMKAQSTYEKTNEDRELSQSSSIFYDNIIEFFNKDYDYLEKGEKCIAIFQDVTMPYPDNVFFIRNDNGFSVELRKGEQSRQNKKYLDKNIYFIKGDSYKDLSFDGGFIKYVTYNLNNEFGKDIGSFSFRNLAINDPYQELAKEYGADILNDFKKESEYGVTFIEFASTHNALDDIDLISNNLYVGESDFGTKQSYFLSKLGYDFVSMLVNGLFTAKRYSGVASTGSSFSSSLITRWIPVLVTKESDSTIKYGFMISDLPYGYHPALSPNTLTEEYKLCDETNSKFNDVYFAYTGNEDLKTDCERMKNEYYCNLLSNYTGRENKNYDCIWVEKSHCEPIPKSVIKTKKTLIDLFNLDLDDDVFTEIDKSGNLEEDRQKLYNERGNLIKTHLESMIPEEQCLFTYDMFPEMNDLDNKYRFEFLNQNGFLNLILELKTKSSDSWEIIDSLKINDVLFKTAYPLENEFHIFDDNKFILFNDKIGPVSTSFNDYNIENEIEYGNYKNDLSNLKLNLDNKILYVLSKKNNGYSISLVPTFPEKGFSIWSKQQLQYIYNLPFCIPEQTCDVVNILDADECFEIKNEELCKQIEKCHGGCQWNDYCEPKI